MRRQCLSIGDNRLLVRNSAARNRAAKARILLCAVALGIGVSIGHGQWLEKVIYLPDSLSGLLWPSCMALNSEYQKVYVAGAYGYSGALPSYVVVLDSRTGEKIGRVEVPSGVASLSYNPVTSKLYAAHNGSITVIDGTNDHVKGQLACNINAPTLCSNTVNGKVYHSSRPGETLAVIDGVGDSVIAKVLVPGAVWSLTFDSLLNRLYCGHTSPNGLTVLDGDADTVIAEIPIPSMWAVKYAVVSRLHRRLYCGGVVDGNPILIIVDTEGDTVLRTIPSGAFCINDLRDELYFTGPNYDTILALDCSGDTVARGLAGFAGREPGMFQCAPGRDLLLALVDHRLFVVDLASGAVVDSAAPVYGPRYVLWDEAEARIYCVNETEDYIIVQDASGESVTQLQIPVGSRPWVSVCATKANKVYFGNMTRGTVYSLDCSSGAIKTFGVGAPTKVLSYDSLDNKVYCGYPDGKVYVIDCAADSIVAVIRAGWGSDWLSYNLSYNPLRNRMYCADSYRFLLLVIDCLTDSIIAYRPLGYTNGPYSLVYNPQRDEILCARHEYPYDEVEVIDCSTNRIVDTVTCSTTCMMYLPGLGKLYLAGYRPPTVVLDAATDSLVTTLSDVTGDVACFNQTENKVYTCWMTWDSRVTVIDAVADSVIGRIGILSPHRPAYDDLNGKVYVTTDPGRVFVLDGATDAILDSIPSMGLRPSSAVRNPVDGRVYVGNYYSGSISVFRDSLVPGLQEEVSAPRAGRNRTIMGQLCLPAGSRRVDVYDISGRRVARLGQGTGSADRLGAGVYYVVDPEHADAIKVVVVR